MIYDHQQAHAILKASRLKKIKALKAFQHARRIEEEQFRRQRMEKPRFQVIGRVGNKRRDRSTVMKKIHALVNCIFVCAGKISINY